MVFIIDKKSVCCAVRIEYLYIFKLVFVFNIQIHNEYAPNAAIAMFPVSDQLRYPPPPDLIDSYYPHNLIVLFSND
jgi:hypothetical protein